MAYGESHAKKTVLKQADALEKKIDSDKSDPETHGDMLLLLVQMIRPIFEARLVTEDECSERMDGICVPSKRISWPAATATFGSVTAICLTIIKLVP